MMMLRFMSFLLNVGVLYCFVRHQRSPRGLGMKLNFELEEPSHILTKAKRSDDGFRPGEPTETHSCSQVRGVPNDLRSAVNMKPNGLDMFYQKYTEAYGIPIIASENVSDNALMRACYVARFMLADHSDVRRSVYKYSGRIGIIGVDEETTTIPEHSHLDSDYWDGRARGLGGQPGNPISTAGEENMLCWNGRYRAQDILVHEFAHGTHLLGAMFAIDGYDKRLNAHYEKVKAEGKIWVNAYAMVNHWEYFAVATQHFLNTTLNDPIDLKIYDPEMFDLVSEVFPCNNTFIDRCTAKPCEDENANCVYWRNIGECEKNPLYMKNYCRKACGVCDPSLNITVQELRQMELDQDLKMNCNPIVIDPNWCHSESNGNCGFWSNIGECTRNPAYMLQWCQASCAECKCPHPESTCKDHHNACCYWAHIGECERNSHYMHGLCPFSCNVCPSEDI